MKVFTKIKAAIKSQATPGELEQLRLVTDINRARVAAHAGETELAISIIEGLHRKSTDLVMLDGLDLARTYLKRPDPKLRPTPESAEAVLHALVRHVAAHMTAPMVSPLQSTQA